MQQRGVIFDLDGTLIDSLRDIGICCNIVLEEFGHAPHAIERYREFVGDGARVLVQNAFPKSCDSGSLEAALTRFKEIYEQNIYENTKAYAGIEEMLLRLDRVSARKGILSNKPHEFTLQYASSIFEGFSFDAVHGQKEGVAIKPHPGVALEIAKGFGLAPSEIFFVGDTATDMRTAKNAGMCAVGVLWGFRGEEELRLGGADYIVSAPGELCGLFGI